MCEMYIPPDADGDLRELDELVGLREDAGNVDERGREPHRAFVHRDAHVRAHALELVGGRRRGCRGRSRSRAPSRR